MFKRIHFIAALLFSPLGVADQTAIVFAKAATPSPITPSKPWMIVGEGGECLVQRDYGVSEDITTLVMRSDPFNATADLLLVAKIGLRLGHGTGKIILAPSGQSVSGEYRGDKLDDGRISLRVVPPDEAPLAVDSVANSSSVLLDAAGVKLAYAISGIGAAIKALKQCNTILLRSWDVNPAEINAIKTFAKPRSSPATWIRASDYPAEDLMNGSQGDTRILIGIDAAGKPTTCRPVVSSGSRAMDATACSAIIAHGSYYPAANASGQPTASHQVQRISWRVAP